MPVSKYTYNVSSFYWELISGLYQVTTEMGDILNRNNVILWGILLAILLDALTDRLNAETFLSWSETDSIVESVAQWSWSGGSVWLNSLLMLLFPIDVSPVCAFIL